MNKERMDEINDKLLNLGFVDDSTIMPLLSAEFHVPIEQMNWTRTPMGTKLYQVKTSYGNLKIKCFNHVAELVSVDA